MALDAYMRITGSSQGEIKGSVTQAGREDSIAVNAMAHEVDREYDPATGAAAGRRQHGPIVVTKEIDRSTPLLAGAWANNEDLIDVDIRFWRPTNTGQEQHYYTIQLVDANIAQIRAEMLNNKYPENASHAVREHITFVYRKIIWTWESDGSTTEDDWGTTVA